MCGIAGILNKGGTEQQELLAQLDTLSLALKHRGPDDRGTWAAVDGVVGLAHVRLSILDLSSAGHQPMHTPDGFLHITFNGEIYNFRELRAELERAGISFQTQTDTEVLLRLYERDGPAMLGKLRGMFAFAIWDEKRRSCFLARDPLGIKPLYYSLRGRRLAFASEMRALQAAKLAGHDIDASALMRYFKTGSVAEPQTLLTDVHCLEAGHYLLWEDGKLAKCSYWQVEFQEEAYDSVQAVADVRAALLDSMRAHFISDVPVGIFLSGGIDSTVLVALAKYLGRQDLVTFSIGVDDHSLDESSVAKRTALHFGTRHQEMRLDAESARHHFAGFLRSMDQPSIDGLNTYTVSAFAHQQGMKVVLSGLGGDELFAGYKSFDEVPKLAAYMRAVRTLPGSGYVLGWLLERLVPSGRLRRIGSMLHTPCGIRDAYSCYRGIFSKHDACQLTAQYINCSVMDVPTAPTYSLHATDPRDAVSECELRFYMRNQLLKDSDVMSMAHGLELRVPFVDQTLFQSLARIPAGLRLRTGKQMLLEAVPEIPAWVSGAPKRGFVFPFDKWLGESWGQAFNSATTKMPLRNPTWYQRWSVFMLDTWLEQHGLT